MTRTRVFAMLLTLLMIATACGGDADDATTADATDDAAAPATDEATEEEADPTEAAPTEEEPTEEEPTEDGAPTEEGSEDAAPEGDGEPLRIASIPALTGALGVFGAAANQAVQYAIDEANAAGGVAGHPVELVTLETDGTAENSISLVERAVNEENAPFITGLITSPELLGTTVLLEDLDAVMINPLGKTTALVAENCNPRFFQVSHSNQQSVNTIAAHIADLDVANWGAIAIDQTTGVDMFTTFSEEATLLEAEVQEPIYVPPGTADYGPQIGDLQSQGTDGLFVALLGGDAVTFTNQAEQFGLLDTYETIVGVNYISDPLFGAVGEAAVGTLNNLSYHHSLDNPANAEWSAAWEAEFGELPYYVHADSYIAMQLLFAAVEAAGSVEPGAVAEALNTVELDTIAGPVAMRGEDGTLLRQEFVGEVITEGDGLSFDIVAEVAPEEGTPPVSDACQR